MGDNHNTRDRSIYQNFDDDIIRDRATSGSVAPSSSFTYVPPTSSSPLKVWRSWLIEQCATWWFLSLVGASFMALFSGTLYGFSIYSTFLKQHLDYDQVHIGFVGAAGNVGIYTGGPIGMFFDRFGPKPTVLFAGLLIFSGYFGVYCAVLGWISHHFLLLALFFFMVGQGSHGTYISCIGTNVWNSASHNTGKIIGWTASLLALSGAFMAIMHHIFFDNDNASFILFLAVVAFGVNMSSLAVITKFPRSTSEATEPRKSIFAPDDSEAGTNNSVNNADRGNPNSPTSTTPLKEIGFPQVFKSIRWWLLFSVSFVALGTGLMFIVNVGSLIKSLNGTQESNTIIITILALSNAAGRLIIGSLSDTLSNHIPRTGFLIIICIINIITFVALCFATINWLIFLTFMVAFHYGGAFTIIPCALKDFYGPKYLGQNFGWMNLSAALGNVLFNLIASKLYDNQVPPETENSHQCYGITCYRTSFIIAAVANAAACGIGVFLTKRANHRANWQRAQ